MPKLLVQLLDPAAKAPTVAHVGEDLGFDLYALENTVLKLGETALVRTGIAATYVADPTWDGYGMFAASKVPLYGLEIRDRSSMATKNGIQTVAGVIDAGYRGELFIAMVLHDPNQHFEAGVAGVEWRQSGYLISAGDKIAQMLPREIQTCTVEVVETLPAGARGTNGFGSTGK